MNAFVLWFIGGLLSVNLAFATKFYSNDTKLDFDKFYPLIFAFSWSLVPLLLPAFVLSFLVCVLRKFALLINLPELPAR